jgi:4-amino-4-deoxy-L-arabinose transferase-like glycosyltransferase
MTDLFGLPTGIFTALTVAVIPNLFAFAHIAVTDMPLASMWFLTAYCFWRGLKSWKWSAVLGLVWGLALATKFPAVLIPIPLILWAHLFYRHSYANNVFALLFVGPVVMILCQPYLWHQPGVRILEFLFEGLSRGYRPETSFTVFFLGQLYQTNQLPWYYPFFIVAIATPEFVLALALVAAACVGFFRERFPAMMLFLVNAVFILLMGIMPGAVLHDGVRQLLSAFPFLAALAGGGFYLIVRFSIKLGERSSSLPTVKDLQGKIPAVLIVLFLFHATLDLYLSHPYQLSYYNRLVGGIRGAYSRGWEMTYFGEAFTPSLLRYLNEKLPPNAAINASFANFLFEYYQQEGRLRGDIVITANESFDYYLLLNRRSVLSPPERALLRSAEPAMTIDIAGVPLVAVFKRAR